MITKYEEYPLNKWIFAKLDKLARQDPDTSYVPNDPDAPAHFGLIEGDDETKSLEENALETFDIGLDFCMSGIAILQALQEAKARHLFVLLPRPSIVDTWHSLTSRVSLEQRYQA
jgi:hypothetical protein